MQSLGHGVSPHRMLDTAGCGSQPCVGWLWGIQGSGVCPGLVLSGRRGGFSVTRQEGKERPEGPQGAWGLGRQAKEPVGGAQGH